MNPNVEGAAQVSTGYITSPAGKREPAFADAVPITIQMQALTKPEIEHLDALNIQGTETSAFANMQLSGVDAVKNKGADVITIGTDLTIPADLRGSKWLVTAVLEGWVTAGWCKVGLTRQKA
ncbi:hypothetical protein BES08_05865 [Novosphingobium resinovorum]|uniref:Uncharacterized protein n=2 Tax=Novosphingobium resinovorum TaxID=158500 RepID=A0A1D8A8S6_9SPHN|nr:hypothetical protein BES08_05865 [Novosphingobium resinovorum]